MQPETWRWLGTTIVAFYAAIVATYREFIARRDKRVNIKVILSFDLIAIDLTGSVGHLQVRVENHGGTNITFKSNSVSLQVDGYERHLLVMEPISDVKFPVVLTPGTSYYLMKE